MKTTTEIAEDLQLKAAAFGLKKIDIENLLLSFTNAVATEMESQQQWQSCIDFLNVSKSVMGELEIEKKEPKKEFASKDDALKSIAKSRFKSL